MTSRDCPQTPDLLNAARAAAAAHAAPAPAAEHAAACPACADALAAEHALRRLDTALQAQATLPSASQILFRAQLRQAMATAENAARPTRIWNRLAGVTAVAATAALLYTRGDALLHHHFHSPALAGVPPLLLLASGATLGLASLLLILHAAWNEG